MSELDKLEVYLRDNKYDYQRYDHTIIVNDKKENEWDVICHPGSYGYKDGLLEAMGKEIVQKEDSEVEGWLTSEEIIRRLEAKEIEITEVDLLQTIRENN